MELCRAAEALLRSRTLPLAFSKASVSSSQYQTRLRRGINGVNEPQSRRNIASSPSLSSPGEATAASTEQSSGSEHSIASGPPLPLDWVRSASNRGNIFSSQQPEAKDNIASLYSDNSEIFANNGNSASDLLASFNRMRDVRKSRELDITRMAQPPGTTPSSLMKMIRSQELKPMTKKPPRLTPQTGRTITLGPGVDLVRGIRLLEHSCIKNRVKGDFNRQRFHERPGLKRKRLKSMRWRKNFMISFRHTVDRVKQLRLQGW
jgi:small subunit ribosomal protein MRP21